MSRWRFPRSRRTAQPSKIPRLTSRYDRVYCGYSSPGGIGMGDKSPKASDKKKKQKEVKKDPAAAKKK